MTFNNRWLVEHLVRNRWVYVLRRPSRERAVDIAASLQETRGGRYQARREIPGELPRPRRGRNRARVMEATP